MKPLLGCNDLTLGSFSPSPAFIAAVAFDAVVFILTVTKSVISSECFVSHSDRTVLLIEITVREMRTSIVEALARDGFLYFAAVLGMCLIFPLFPPSG